MAGHEVFATGDELDVRQLDPLEQALGQAEPDAVIHLAALSSVAGSWKDPATTYQVNYVGTTNLLDVIERNFPRVRVLLLGSADEYVTTEANSPAYTEATGLRPASPYARTKAACELLGAVATERGLDVVRTRSFNHTGAGQSDLFVASSFARQLAEMTEGVRAQTMSVGNLQSVRDFLDVDDVISAYIALLDPGVPANVYNVASGTPLKIEDLLATLIDLAGVNPEVSVNPDYFRPTDQLVGDATRLREATGWAPQIPLRDTLSALLEGWRAQIRAERSAP